MKGKSLPEAESPAHLTFKEYKDSENPAHERIMQQTEEECRKNKNT